MGEEDGLSRVHNYVICTTQRSGKSWLCDVLRRVGGFGSPEEHVLAIVRNKVAVTTVDMMVRWIGDVMRTEPVAFALQWDALVALQGMLKKGREEIFGRLVSKHGFKVVFLERKDRMQQAISKYLLLRSGYGHSYQPDELKKGRKNIEFDAEGILRCYRTVVEDYASWESMFDTVGVVPTRVSYEEMCCDMPAVVTRIALAIGRKTDGLDKEMHKCVSAWKKIGDKKDVEFRDKMRRFLARSRRTP